MFFPKQVIESSKHRTTQHGGMEGEQEEVSMCFFQTTVCFSVVIDRQSFSVTIVRGLCDVWTNMNVVTFVTEEQNALSLCPGEGPSNLVTVKFVAVLCGASNLTCILVPLHLQMSTRTCM